MKAMVTGAAGVDDQGVTGQMPRAVATLGLAALAAVGLGGCTTPSARSVAPVVTDVRAASIIDRQGNVRVARSGDRVRAGEFVRTASEGAATLTVLGRRVLLGSSTFVGAPNGAELDLRAGDVLVDRRRGPEVRLTAGDLRVDEVERGAVRVERGYALRVAVLSGSARVSTVTGRRTSVRELRQVVVAGHAVPDRPGPLVLRDDAWEREVVPDLYAANVALNRLARGLDAQFPTAGAALRTVPAAYSAGTLVNRSVAPSDALLPVAIGRVATLREDVATRIRRAASFRAEGASWGVAAALLRARHASVAAAIAAALTSALGPPGGGPAVVALPPPGESPQGPPGTRGGGRPQPTPSPSRSSSPSPTPSPSQTGTVDRVVDTVQRLLPTPLPSLALL